MPGAPRTALVYCLRTNSECVVIVRSYQWPDDGGTMPGKDGPLTTRVESVSPPKLPEGDWWRRRALPPGPQRLSRAAFITIVGRDRSLPTRLI